MLTRFASLRSKWLARRSLAPHVAQLLAGPRRASKHLFAVRDLSGLQKGFDEFAFAADAHAGKPFEPSPLRHFRFESQPVRQESELIGGDVPAAYAVEQVIEKARGKAVAADARHGLLAVKTAMDFIPQFRCFGGVVRLRHALGEIGQLVTGQLAFARQFEGELNHARLFRAGQMLDFLDDTGGGHGCIVLEDSVALKRKSRNGTAEENLRVVRWPDLVEAWSGKVLKAHGVLEPTRRDPAQLLAALRRPSAAAPPTDEWAIWLRWFRADRATHGPYPLTP